MTYSTSGLFTLTTALELDDSNARLVTPKCALPITISLSPFISFMLSNEILCFSRNSIQLHCCSGISVPLPKPEVINFLFDSSTNIPHCFLFYEPIRTILELFRNLFPSVSVCQLLNPKLTFSDKSFK